jgi:hypothetical protein
MSGEVWVLTNSTNENSHVLNKIYKTHAYSKSKKKKVKLSPLQAAEAYRVERR